MNEAAQGISSVASKKWPASRVQQAQEDEGNAGASNGRGTQWDATEILSHLRLVVVIVGMNRQTERVSS